MTIADEFHPLAVVAVERATPDCIVVTLVVPDDLAERFRYRPGQHVNVRAAPDGDEVRRTYSICSDPSEPGLRIAIKNIRDGYVSAWANEKLKPGMTLDVMPPAGRFVLPPGDGTPRHIVGLAAGAGITPIIGIARQVLREEPRSLVTLVYGNRRIEDIIFRAELEDLKDRHLGRFTLAHVLSGGEAQETPLLDGRLTGDKVQALSAQLFPVGEVAEAYLCGPGSFIRDSRRALLDLGLARERVHHEIFAAGGGAHRGPAPPVVPVSAPSPEPGETGPEIIAVLDGVRHRFRARPGEAVVDAALRAGVRVPYACKGGMCCTCRAKLIEGSAPMRLNYSLEAWEIERGFVLTCQAVVASARLVVDYDQM